MSDSVLNRWSKLDVPPAVLRYFRGLFDRIGVRISDTGEAVTCTQTNDAIVITPGLDEAQVDFTVEILAYQAERLAAAVTSGDLDAVERFRIARAFLQRRPSRRDILRNPLMANPLLRWMIGGRSVLHIHLISPDATVEPDANFTMIHTGREWVVVPGLHGTPGRVFRVTESDAQDLQRRFHQAAKAGGLFTWFGIARWYVDWRRRVEVRV